MIFEKALKLQEEVNKPLDFLTKKQRFIELVTPDSELIQLITLVYGPEPFHIKPVKLPKTASKTPEAKEFLPLLQKLRDREITGNEARQAIADFIIAFPQYKELILAILKKNLEIRFNTTIINQCIPDLIPVFSVCLAHLAEEKRVENSAEWLAMRKFDGLRLVVELDLKAKTAKAYTREGILYQTLEPLKKECLEQLQIRPELQDYPIFLDGELTSSPTRDNFQEIVAQWNRKDYQIEDYGFIIFDCLTHAEFYGAITSPPYLERLERLQSTSSRLIKVETSSITSEEVKDNFKLLLEKAKHNHWEGVMVRKNAPYRSGRTFDLLKVKPKQDLELKVVATKSNPRRVVENGQEHQEEMLRKVIVDYKGYEVSVGTGFTLEQRRLYHKHPEKIIGCFITVEFMEESTDKDGNLSLRHPRLKHIWPREGRQT